MTGRHSAAATADFLSQSRTIHLLFALFQTTETASLGWSQALRRRIRTRAPRCSYELGVVPSFRRRGIATALVRALAALATDHGCYGMWVAVNVDNDAALATYRRASAGQQEAPCVTLSWNLTVADD